MADRDEGDPAGQERRAPDSVQQSVDAKPGLSPEGRQLLQLIRQDFSLLRSSLSNALEAFIDYDHNEFAPPEQEELITGAELEETIGRLREGVEAHITGLDRPVVRFEAEVNRLAEAFIHVAGPEQVREQGYVRILANGREDWEGPLLAERTDPFGGDYWGERIARKDHPASVRVDGVQYMLRAEHDHLPGFKGHGGKDFYLRFDDGRLVHTTNLWLNGPIPQEHRDLLPDNAAFLDRADWDAHCMGQEQPDSDRREHAASAGPSHPWPSEIARAHRQERAEGEGAKPAEQALGADHGDGHSA